MARAVFVQTFAFGFVSPFLPTVLLFMFTPLDPIRSAILQLDSVLLARGIGEIKKKADSNIYTCPCEGFAMLTVCIQRPFLKSRCPPHSRCCRGSF